VAKRDRRFAWVRRDSGKWARAEALNIGCRCSHTHCMTSLRLTCRLFWVDARVSRFGDRWLASADTPDGPTLGLGHNAQSALAGSLEAFRHVRPELLASLPKDWAR
jgi:hypothetical protein